MMLDQMKVFCSLVNSASGAQNIHLVGLIFSGVCKDLSSTDPLLTFFIGLLKNSNAVNEPHSFGIKTNDHSLEFLHYDPILIVPSDEQSG